MVRPLVAVGVAAIAVGFVAAVDRGVAAAVDPSAVMVTLVGALGVLQGVRYANGRRNRQRHAASPGEPERRRPATVPGAALDERIARATEGVRSGRRARREVSDRIRALAVATVARARSVPAETAAELVESGEWTDDPTAAAFLSRSASYPVRVRLRAMVSGSSRFALGLRAATEALVRVEAGESSEAERRSAGEEP